MRDSQKSCRLHPIIDNILYRVEDHKYQVDIHQDILDWNEQHKAKWELSEDETELNQNVVGEKYRTDKDFVDYARSEVEYHKQELENVKILLRIYMEAFNGGWEF